MKVKTMLCAFSLSAALLSSAAFAQEPVRGVSEPEKLFTDADPVLNRNKQATLHIMRELLQCGQWDRAGEWLTDKYIQHNPNAASGLQGVVYFFTQVLKVPRKNDCAVLTTEIAAVMADGDYVTVLWPRTYVDPRDPANSAAACQRVAAPPSSACPGKTYSTSWFDTWRFVNGKADEHWDPATITPPAPR